MNKESEMGEVKRYKHRTLFGNPCLCVSADDYDALRAENAELVTTLKRVVSVAFSGRESSTASMCNIASNALAKRRGE